MFFRNACFYRAHTGPDAETDTPVTHLSKQVNTQLRTVCLSDYRNVAH